MCHDSWEWVVPMRISLFVLAIVLTLLGGQLPILGEERSVVFEKTLSDGATAVVEKYRFRKTVKIPEDQAKNHPSAGVIGGEYDCARYSLKLLQKDGREDRVWEDVVSSALSLGDSLKKDDRIFLDVSRASGKIAILDSSSGNIVVYVVETNRAVPGKVPFCRSIYFGSEAWSSVDDGHLVWMGDDLYIIISNRKEDRIEMWVLKNGLISRVYPAKGTANSESAP